VDLVDLVLLGVGKMDGWQGGEGRGGEGMRGYVDVRR
jgi:hypothetical protein